jgi:LysM repeat protein
MSLSLADFKRPPQDNGRGVHGPAPSGWSGVGRGLDYWIGELEALGITWVQFVDSNCDSLPLCQKLIAVGIFPVVRILRRDPPPNDLPEPNPGHLNSGEEETIKKLIDAGVLYFETNSEPNLGTQWKNGAIPTDPEEAAKLVALNWLFDARFILEAGGYPGLPAISIGNSMDLIGALALLGRQDILLEGCWIAIHNYGLGRPLNYPADSTNQIGAPLSPDQYDVGPFTKWAWWNRQAGRADTRDEVNQIRASRKQVGSTIFQDHACFREYDYYAALAQKHLSRPIPILSTEGGYSVGQRVDQRYPRVTPQMHAELTVALFDFMQREAPEYYFACMPSCLLPSAGLESEAWYSDYWQLTFQKGPRADAFLPPFSIPGASLGVSLPVVAAVKGMANVQRGRQQMSARKPFPISAKPPPPPPPPSEESIYSVLPGDTLAGIAERFSTTVPSLLALNRIVDQTRIVPGQRMIIPANSTVAPPSVRVPNSPPLAPAEQAQKGPPLPPKPRGWDQFDPRLAALNVRVLNAMVPAGYPYWRLVRAEYQDPTQAGGHHYVSYSVLDEKGMPVPGQRVLQGWAEDQAETRTDHSGNARMPITESYSPERGESGPYSVWVDGLPSDRVAGLGLPVHRQVNFSLTWQKAVR